MSSAKNSAPRLLAGLISVLLTSALAAPAVADVDWTLDLRARWEVNDAPTASPVLDPTFDFTNLRARLGLDLKGRRWSVHGVLQGAGTYDLPTNGSFGIAPVYLSANAGETDPTDLGLLEASVAYAGERLSLRLGRQGWADGVETLTGVGYLDGVKKRRLGERLLGNWDWVNVGRRYDGVSLGVTWERFHLAAFGFQPLAGGVDYDDAFEGLDDLDVYGLTWTGRYGATLGKGEWRLFDVEYRDERPGALAAAGGPIEISTLGGSLLLGGERQDLLLWIAFQTGDWGPADHQALAWMVEAGRLVVDGELKVQARLGLAEASGDPARGGDHESFFNLLPTNHKFYGSIDYSAFSNLRDLYVDAVVARGPWTVTLGVHRFELPETADAWYGGSGAFDDRVLGYAARRPAAGSFGDNLLGHELDVTAGRKLGSAFVLEAGAAIFDGGDAAREVLRLDADGFWGYLQLSWRR